MNKKLEKLIDWLLKILDLLLADDDADKPKDPDPTPDPPKPEVPDDPFPPPPPLPPPPLPTSPEDVSREAMRQEMLIIHNRLRKEVNVVALWANEALDIVAQRQANYQASVGGWNNLHGRPPGSSLQTDIAGADISARTYGENAAAGQRSVVAACNGWKESRGHYKNMTSPNFRYVGFGYAVSKQGTPYWIAVFAG